MAKFSEIKDLKAEEVNGRIRELKQEALQLRVQHSAGQLENTARIRQIRREVTLTPGPIIVRGNMSSRNKKKKKFADYVLSWIRV